MVFVVTNWECEKALLLTVFLQDLNQTQKNTERGCKGIKNEPFELHGLSLISNIFHFLKGNRRHKTASILLRAIKAILN